MTEGVNGWTFIDNSPNDLAHKVLKDAAEGELEVRWKSEELVQLHEQMKSGQRRTHQSISGSALLLSGVLLATLGSAQVPPGLLPFLSGSLGLLGCGLIGFALIRR